MMLGGLLSPAVPVGGAATTVMPAAGVSGPEGRKLPLELTDGSTTTTSPEQIRMTASSESTAPADAAASDPVSQRCPDSPSGFFVLVGGWFQVEGPDAEALTAVTLDQCALPGHCLFSTFQCCFMLGC